MSEIYPLHWFEGFGVELEYMVVDRDSLNIEPVVNLALETAAGESSPLAYLGDTIWSCELAAHVLEIKTNGPAPTLNGLSDRFRKSVFQANDILEIFNAGLLPTAMHPWMDPQTETHIYPFPDKEVYLAFDRIFNCRSHGWVNLQSAHLNLPFATEEEFVRMHTAIRLVLPLIPAIAASSPLIEGRFTGWLDTRLEVYRTNQAKVPSITGMIIPEPVQSIAEYHDKILARIYKDIAPYDLNGSLEGEWLNSRGAIARFSRGAIEIRIIDIQESPAADIAVAAAIVAAVKALCEERYSSSAVQSQISTEYLGSLLLKAAKVGGIALIDNAEYLEVWGLNQASAVTLNALWSKIIEDNPLGNGDDASRWHRIMKFILTQGCLAERIIMDCGVNPSHAKLKTIYNRLRDCLISNVVFI